MNDKKILTIIMLFYYTLLIFSCQSENNQIKEVKGMASFYADPRILEENNPKPTKEQLETVWLINGQKLTWGSKPIYILPDSSNLDTIYFKEDNNSNWDTIICNIKVAKAYTLSPNECCGGFMTGQAKIRVEFNIEKPSKKNFLGEYGGSAILAKYKKKAILDTHCLGLMVSNITHIQLSDIEIRKDSSNNADRPICFYENYDKEASGDFYYKTNKKLVNFLFMPLNDETVIINYNIETDKKTIKIH
jgi:hypothetical protein